jgi:hypothetical protein
MRVAASPHVAAISKEKLAGEAAQGGAEDVSLEQ